MNNRFLLKSYIIIFMSFFVISSIKAAVVNDLEAETNYQKIQQTKDRIYNFMVDKLYPEMKAEKNAKQSSKLIMEHNLSGNSGYSKSLGGNVEQQNFHDWTPSTLDLEEMVGQGLQTGSLSDQVKFYNNKFHQPVVGEMNDINSIHEMQAYTASSFVNSNFSLGLADVDFNRSQTLHKQLTHLYALLDQQNSLKQSADLRNAVALKIIEIESELLRLQAQQLKLRALSQQKNNLKRFHELYFIQNIE